MLLVWLDVPTCCDKHSVSILHNLDISQSAKIWTKGVRKEEGKEREKEKKKKKGGKERTACWLVGWLLNATTTHLFISGTELHMHVHLPR